MSRFLSIELRPRAAIENYLGWFHLQNSTTGQMEVKFDVLNFFNAEPAIGSLEIT